MLLKSKVIDQIKAGEISAVFRVWKRPTVKKGGTLTTRKGVMFIDDIRTLAPSEVKPAHLAAAGLDSIDEILDSDRKGDLYFIRLHYHGEDPRIALRENVDRKELDKVCEKLDKMGDWAGKYLDMIGEQPNIHAQILADSVGLEKRKFKARVRRLKTLGLTESLRPGYKLSKRGQAVLRLIAK